MIRFLFFIFIVIGSSFPANEGKSLSFNGIFDDTIKDMISYFKKSEEIVNKEAQLKQRTINFFQTKKIILPLIGLFAVGCFVQKKGYDIPLKKALINSSLLSCPFFVGALGINYQWKTELEKINEKSKSLSDKKEVFEKETLFSRKLIVFSEAQKLNIFEEKKMSKKN